MKTNKKLIQSNFKELSAGKKRPFQPLNMTKKHRNHQNQAGAKNRPNIKGHNLHDLIKKVA